MLSKVALRRFLSVTTALLCLAVMPRSASAGPLVVGAELDFDGSVRVTETMIDWYPLGGGTGTAVIQPTSTLSFAPLAGTNVIELDLASASYPVGPAGTFDPVAFETLQAQPTTVFTLVAINPCTFNCLAGADSPFNFIEIPDGVGGFNTTIILSMFGTLVDPVLNPGQTFAWTGTWSADFTGLSAAQILNMLDAQGFIDAPYSAEKVVITEQVIPEPATLLTFGTGSLLLGAVARRRRAKAAKKS